MRDNASKGIFRHNCFDYGEHHSEPGSLATDWVSLALRIKLDNYYDFQCDMIPFLPLLFLPLQLLVSK